MAFAAIDASLARIAAMWQARAPRTPDVADRVFVGQVERRIARILVASPVRMLRALTQIFLVMASARRTGCLVVDGVAVGAPAGENAQSTRLPGWG
jgi:hypothetical protein